MQNKYEQYADTNLFKRFLQVPLALSAILALTIRVSFLIALAAFLERHFGIGYVLICVFAGLNWTFGFLVDAVKQSAMSWMVGERLRAFGKGKFESWKDFIDFLDKIGPDEIDRVAGLDDDDWMREDFDL